MTSGGMGRPTPARILIIGLSAGGADSLPLRLLERISGADLLVGGSRHLSYFPHFQGDRFSIEADIQAVAERLQQALTNGEQAVVLASGDPLCYGVGASLRRYFPAETLEIIPGPTAFQLAFAALAEPWSGATLLSAHARPLPEVVSGVLGASKAAILTDRQHTPLVIAQALLGAGLAPHSRCAVCENLGSTEQRIVQTTLAGVGAQEYAPLNVFVVWPDQNSTERVRRDGDRSSGSPHRPGLPDAAFSTSAGQITKREIRLLSLAELALAPGEIMWDIGAGSGAVAIEAARSQPTATVYAVEKRAEMCRHLQANLARFPAPNLHWFEGIAPEATANWPDPQAVFIGGTGGRLEEVVEVVRQRLDSGGRLVINLVTLENLHIVRRLLPEAHLVQAQISRGVPILDMLRFEALNPVFIVTWRKA